MNIRRFAAALFTAAIVVVLSSWVTLQVVHAQCNPSDPACGGQEKEKKLRPTETAVPRPTATAVPVPNTAFGPISGPAGNAAPDLPGSNMPGANLPGGMMPGWWWLPVMLMVGVVIGGIWWKGMVPRGPRTPMLPKAGESGLGGVFAKFNRQAPPGSRDYMTLSRGDPDSDKETAARTRQDP